MIEQLRANLTAVREKIAAACRRRGRGPDAVRLVVVTKYAPAEAIGLLPRLGVYDLGENRVQQLVRRAEQFGATADAGLAGLASAVPADGKPRWHMIGHLQRNKVRALLAASRIVHSLDSERLARQLDQDAQRTGVTVDALIEVNVSGEASKEGVLPEEAAPLAEAACRLSHVRLAGLMTMAPLVEDAEQVRPYFARLRELLEGLRGNGIVPPECGELSMGMTNDYAVAVEEGATIVRIGSAIFEGVAAGPTAGG